MFHTIKQFYQQSFPMKTPPPFGSRHVINTLLFFCVSLSLASANDVYWTGSVSSNWSDASNWSNNLPSTPGTANTIINAGSPNNSPEVSTDGNSTVGALYLSTDAGLSVSGGSLSVGGWLLTGQFGVSRVLDVAGGALSVAGTLALGNGGFQGNVNISGGTVTANGLSINTVSGSIMNSGGTGSFVTPLANPQQREFLDHEQSQYPWLRQHEWLVGQCRHQQQSRQRGHDGCGSGRQSCDDV
jgi:hypothetical protein